jgi:LysM repeat protein
MSAGVVGALIREPVGIAFGGRRAPLRLVASGGNLLPDERLRGPAVPSPGVNGRRRLVITVVTIFAIAALALVLAASVDAAAPAIDHTTVVSPGETLSAIAATQLPSLPIRDGVSRIQLVNGLNSYQVHAGQTLLIPVIP